MRLCSVCATLHRLQSTSWLRTTSCLPVQEAMQATHLERFWAHFRAGPLPAHELEVQLPSALTVGLLLLT